MLIVFTGSKCHPSTNIKCRSTFTNSKWHKSLQSSFHLAWFMALNLYLDNYKSSLI